MHGHHYGTPKTNIEKHIRQGDVVLLDIDVIGAEIIRRKRGSRDVSIFLLPPTLNALRERLRKRRDTQDTMQERLANARQEFKHTQKYTYWVVNDSLQTAVKQIEGIIAAERLKPSRHALTGTRLAKLVRN